MKLYRPVTVLVGVLFVVAGGLVRLADPNSVFDEPNRDRVQATIGQRLPVGESAVEVKRIRFARTLLEDPDSAADPATTDGVFVAVEVEAVRGPGDRTRLEATLRSAEDTQYRPVQQIISTGIDFPEPGFVRTFSLVYEVNPTDVAGLTLELKASSLWSVLVTDYAVDLGLPDEKTAEELIGRAAQTYALPETVTRVAT